jgi:putative heme transporter
VARTRQGACGIVAGVDEPTPNQRRLSDVVSPREARLLFWLVVLALVAVIATLGASFTSVLATPAIILFVAWLMAYVLEPFVSLLQRHMPFKGRGPAVALTYLITGFIAIVVLLGAGIAILQAAIAFVDNLPAIITQLGETLKPILSGLGIAMPGGTDLVTAIQQWFAANAGQIADAVQLIIRNAVVVVGSLITAVFISIGLAVGEVSLLGWTKRFLPTSTYRDISELEQAIAVSFGGFVRGRLLIGAIYGAVIGIAAVLLGIPYAPLIAVIAGLIAFIPWIGPLIGWAVLPAFAALLAPGAVTAALVISLLGAGVIQVVVTPFVMAGAVDMRPVAVFTVVILGTAVAGIIGAIFAIPTAAAILAVTDYLRKRDVMLRSEDEPEAPTVPEAATAEST